MTRVMGALQWELSLSFVPWSKETVVSRCLAVARWLSMKRPSRPGTRSRHSPRWWPRAAGAEWCIRDPCSLSGAAAGASVDMPAQARCWSGALVRGISQRDDSVELPQPRYEVGLDKGASTHVVMGCRKAQQVREAKNARRLGGENIHNVQ